MVEAKKSDFFEGVFFNSKPEKNPGQIVEAKKIRLE